MSSSLIFQAVETLLARFNQKQLLSEIQSLSHLQKLAIFYQLKEIEKKWQPKKAHVKQPLPLLTEIEKGDNPFYEKKGKEILQKGKASVAIFAGGIGSRTCSSIPKAIIPIGDNKTLLSLFCQKIMKYQKEFSQKFPILIMVSDKTKDQILSYLKRENYCHLPRGQIEIFSQESYPFEDEKNQWQLSEGKILELPNGNGDIFRALLTTSFFASGRFKEYDYLHISNIDNYLADPLSPALMGYAAKMNAEITFQVFPRKEKEEQVGLITKRGTSVRIEEYIEREEVVSGELGFGNIGHYCFDIRELYRQLLQEHLLDYHWVKKSWQKMPGFKAEKFVFDIFPHFSRIYPLAFSKESSFYPLKTKEDFKKINKEYLKSPQNI